MRRLAEFDPQRRVYWMEVLDSTFRTYLRPHGDDLPPPAYLLRMTRGPLCLVPTAVDQRPSPPAGPPPALRLVGGSLACFVGATFDGAPLTQTVIDRLAALGAVERRRVVRDTEETCLWLIGMPVRRPRAKPRSGAEGVEQR
jgi:hypothetical protein